MTDMTDDDEAETCVLDSDGRTAIDWAVSWPNRGEWFSGLKFKNNRQKSQLFVCRAHRLVGVFRFPRTFASGTTATTPGRRNSSSPRAIASVGE